MTETDSDSIELDTRTVEYAGGGQTMRGFLAREAGVDEPRPGVLVVHEWWGQTDYARFRAEALAELGYVALAVDLYGDGRTADNPDDAGEMMNALIEDTTTLRERFDAALEVLAGDDGVDEECLAAIGYCFGGGVVLHMARMGSPLVVVGSFHGSLPLATADDGPDEVDTQMVVYHGGDDVLVDDDAVADFLDAMDDLDADCQFIELPGAKHGFSNPAATANGEKFGFPIGYDALADEASWAHLQLVLREALG